MKPSSYSEHKLQTIASYQQFLEQQSSPAYPLEIFLEISNVCNLTFEYLQGLSTTQNLPQWHEPPEFSSNLFNLRPVVPELFLQAPGRQGPVCTVIHRHRRRI